MRELLFFSTIPLIATILYGASLPVVGAALFARNELLLAIALPAVAGAGLTVGLAVLPPSLFSTFALYLIITGLVVAVSIVANRKELSPVRRQLLLGGLFAGSQSITGILMAISPATHTHMKHVLNGEILAINSFDIIATTIIIAIIIVVGIRNKYLVYAYLIDEERLCMLGRRNSVSLFFRVSVALIISFAVMQTGPLLSIAFLILPLLFGDTGRFGMSRFIKSSSLIGILSAVIGFYISISYDLPPAHTVAFTVLPTGLAFKFIFKLRCLR